MRENGNKSELFQLISEKATETTFPGQVVITCGQEVKCAQGTVADGLSPSTHEEADTRMLLHAANGAREGYTRIMLRTVVTDVVVLAVSLANKLACDNLWVAFGTGNNFRYLDASAIAQQLGDDKSAALPQALQGEESLLLGQPGMHSVMSLHPCALCHIFQPKRKLQNAYQQLKGL